MFGSNFFNVRNNYALSLTDVEINLKDYKEHKIRSTLLHNAVSVNDTAIPKSYLIEVPASLFYKSITTEYELYHVRSLMQLSDFYSMDNKINDSWKFTTYYYFIFFSNIALHRLLQKGYLYFDEENAKTLNNIFSTFLSYNVDIGTGNWFFKKHSETSSLVTIELKKVGSNVHQLIWQDLKSTLKKFVGNTSTKLNDPEKVILINLYNLIKSDNKFSPSETRNFLNYVSEIALEEVDNKILCPQIKVENFIKSLSSFNFNKDLVSKMTLSMLIGHYIFLFNKEIIEDLENRNSKLFKLKKKYKRQNP